MTNPFEWSEIVQAFSAVVTGAMAIFLYITTRKINQFTENFNIQKAVDAKETERHQFFHNFIEHLNHMNSVVVSSDKNLEIVKEYGKPDPEDSIGLARKEWLTFMWLNILQIAFIGKNNGLLYEEYAETTLNQLLPMLMKDATAYRLVKERAYQPDFVRYCDKVYEMLNREP